MAVLRKVKSNTLIIGSGGYIGSRLKEEIIAPDKVDINWFRSGGKGTDFKDLTREFYSEYDNIILLSHHIIILSYSQIAISSYYHVFIHIIIRSYYHIIISYCHILMLSY